GRRRDPARRADRRARPGHRAAHRRGAANAQRPRHDDHARRAEFPFRPQARRPLRRRRAWTGDRPFRRRRARPQDGRPRRATRGVGEEFVFCIPFVKCLPLVALYGQLLLGLINGSFYALLSLGLAVIFGMLRVINFAHGALYMLGAFVSWWLSISLG